MKLLLGTVSSILVSLFGDAPFVSFTLVRKLEIPATDKEPARTITREEALRMSLKGGAFAITVDQIRSAFPAIEPTKTGIELIAGIAENPALLIGQPVRYYQEGTYTSKGGQLVPNFRLAPGTMPKADALRLLSIMAKAAKAAKDSDE